MKYFKYISSNLFLVMIFALCANCNANPNSCHDDSVRMADSIASVKAEEQRLEAARQDSIVHAESERYDKMLTECEALLRSYNKYINEYLQYTRGVQGFDDRTNYHEKAVKSYDKYIEKYEEILKVIDNFSPEQFERVQKMERTIINPGGILWG